MEAAGNGGASAGQDQAQLLISGVGGDQPLVMSAEDAAQFLAQAGLQLADVADSGEQVIINSAGLENAAELVKEENPPTMQQQLAEQGAEVAGDLGDFNDGTVLYIDPNDPQAAALLQQAGLTITEDGTVIGGLDESAVQHDDQVEQDQGQQQVQGQNEIITSDSAESQLGTMIETPVNANEVPQELFMSTDDIVDSKENLNLQPVTEAQGAVEMAMVQEAPQQLSTDTTTTPAVTGTRMTPAAASPKKVIVNATPTTIKETVTTSTIKTPKSRIVTPSSIQQVETPTLPTSPPPPPVQVSMSSPATIQATPTQAGNSATNTITVGPDQQQVFYTVSGEDGKTQQYMMLCPKDMDQNTLITTLVRQISADPSNKGKKTIRITQHKSTPSIDSQQQQQQVHSAPAKTSTTTIKRGRASTSSTPKTSRVSKVVNEILPDPKPPKELTNIVDSSENFESVVPELAEQVQMQAAAATSSQPAPTTTLSQGQQVQPGQEEVRVYVRCNYCESFRSTLNSDTWEAILNHILPVAKEEIQTTFYGDLEKHFYRSVRIQINGRQMVRTRTPSGSSEVNIPQVEVVLTHSLVCRKTRREFIVDNPDAGFVANLAKHIRQMQPGSQMAKANSLLCIFCNAPYTYEDYLRHIQPNLDVILSTLMCFGGAYCATTYESTIRASKPCQAGEDPEPADLRFLPCIRFSAEYQSLSKLQFAIECFRENCGENGFMKLNTNTLARCTVCKNPQQVYCTLFHITSTILNEADDTTRDVDTQLSVCVNCQKQFINIVMKEQNFDEKLKQFQLRNMEQLCSCLRVILGQAKAISEGRKTLIYTVQETNSTTPNPSAVHTVRLAEITDINPITRLIALAETEVVGSNVKAFFMCDLCMFTIDLTSILVTPGSTQKNELLIAVVLEHLVPHTESLLSVIANTAGSKTFNFKMEVKARVTTERTGHRKIVLSLQKKFVSSQSGLEIVLEKDEERTLNQLRASVRADRQKNFVNIRTKSDGGTTIMQASPNNSSQLVDVNKFIDKQKGKLSTLAQCGCNTQLLSAYTECRLCGKFCFPDFRLSGAPQKIDLCENCVETVLTLCLPSDPEVLEVGEECLALQTEKVVGHRLVLANNVKKWLSLDGVNIIKKTVEEFNSSSNSVFSRLADCGPIFSEALKQHLLANLKTCYSDEDIVTAVTGFSVTDDFFRNAKYTGRDAETAAALASLQEQIDVPIREADSANRNIIIRRKLPERQIEVKILERRPPGSKKTPIPIRIGPPLRGAPRGQRGFSNGMVVDLGGNTGRRSLVISPSGQVTNVVRANKTDLTDEESVSAIQSFINDTKPTSPSVRITSTATGVVNIKAVNEASSPMPAAQVIRQIPTSTPRGRGRPPKTPQSVPSDFGSVRNMKGVSMVTLTAGGIIKKVTPSQPVGKRKRGPDLLDSDDEGDSDDLYDDEDEMEDGLMDVSAGVDAGANAQVNNGKKIKGEDREYRPPRKLDESGELLESPSASDSDLNRSKRQRKEKKIFDL